MKFEDSVQSDTHVPPFGRKQVTPSSR